MEVSATQTEIDERDLSQCHLLPGTVKQTRTAAGLLPGFVADRELPTGPLPWLSLLRRKMPASTGGAGDAKVDTALPASQS